MPANTADEITVSFYYFGLESSSSLETVREAYRRYAKKFHPDLFPKDSPEQKMAQEKFIAANNHFEKLEKFFEERASRTEEDARKAHDESDWEAWEKDRQHAFEDELKDWIDRQNSLEEQKVAGRESFRRRKLVRNCRVAVILITVSMWMGWFSENAKLHERKNAAEERHREITQNPHPQPGFFDQASGQDVDQMWRNKVEKLRREQGFVKPDDELKEMPGKIILILLWTMGAGWLLFSSKGKALADKYLAEQNEFGVTSQAPWVILSIIAWPLIGTAVWFICGNANTGFFAACVGAFTIWMIGRDKMQNYEAELENPPAKLFSASDFDVLASIKEVMQNSIDDKWWVQKSFDDTPDEEGFFKVHYIMTYKEELNTNPPTLLDRQLILKIRVKKVASKTSVELSYQVTSEKIRWTANSILENTTALIWQRLERLETSRDAGLDG